MKTKITIIAALTVILVFLPFILPPVHLNMLIEIAFFALFAMSFSMLFSHGGLLSFGHAAYFGIGAYTVAIIFKYFSSMPIMLAILSGGIAGGLGGLLAGIFCVRLRGAYFALLTLAFNQFFFALALKWRSLTGGDDGLSIERGDFYLPGMATIAMKDVSHIYYLVIIVVVICVLFLWYLPKTPFGNSALTVKENDQRAAFISYNVYLTKITLYTICSFFAGIAGSLFAFFQGFVSTSAIDLAMSMQVVFMTFIGGAGSFLGPIIGSGVYLYFTSWASRITDRWEFVLGVLFILLVMYLRTGLMGLFRGEKMRKIFRLKGATNI